jgi:hypothetical protein
MVDTTVDKVKFDNEADVKPLALSLKKVFAPLFKVVPSLVKIPKEIKRLTDNLKKDMDSGMPERNDNANERLMSMTEILTDHFLKAIQENQARAQAQLEDLKSTGAPAKVVQTGAQTFEARVLNEMEILKEQNKLKKQTKLRVKTEEKIAILKEKSYKGEEGAQKQLNKEITRLKRITDKEQQTAEGLGDKAHQPGPSGGGESNVPLPLQEFGENLKAFFTAPLEAFQQLGSTVKSFLKPFKGLVKGFKGFGKGLKEVSGDDDGGGGIIFTLMVAFKALKKALTAFVMMIVTAIVTYLAPLLIPLGLIVGAFALLKTAVELLIKGFTTAYNWIASWVPGMDSIGTTDDEKTLEKETKFDSSKSIFNQPDKKTNQQLSNEALDAKSNIAQREADAGGFLGTGKDMYGNNLQDKADRLKEQQVMRAGIEDRTQSGLMNIINQQSIQQNTTDNVVITRPSIGNTVAVDTS